jgi:hypothetical protein
MIAYIVILFILYVAFFIGWRVGRSVPDEVSGAGKYMRIAVDVLLLLTIITLMFFDMALWSVILLALGIGVRFFYERLRFAVSGIVLGLAVLAPIELQYVIVVLCLLQNYLYGVTEENSQKLLLASMWQPIVGIIVGLIVPLLF